MNRIKDMTGRKIGYLTVTSFSHTYNGIAYWICECKCGNMTSPIRGSHLRKSLIQSCGCKRVDHMNEVNANRDKSKKIKVLKDLKEKYSVTH